MFTPPLTHFTFNPGNQVYGVLDSRPAAEGVSRELLTLGLLRVQILSGPQGLSDLDPDGHFHGLGARLLRYVQGLTDERSLIEQYAGQLRCGRLVLGVRLSGRARLSEVRSAFVQHGGHAVHHFGALVTQPLCP
jgi:hypothetical protein